MKIRLISLVGEQPIPNLIPLWQHPERYSSVLFCMTTETLNQFALLKQAIRSDARLSHITVENPAALDAYQIQSAAQKISAMVKQNPNAAAILNLTGGTKLMSIAGFSVCLEFSLPFLYVSTQEGAIIEHDSSGAEISKEAIQVNVSVAQYLAAHGLEMYSPHPYSDLEPPKAGDELEALVYETALSCGKFDDVQRNVHIRRPGRVNDVKNELDVVFTRNGVMVVCSCKSGKRITKEMLYELSSLSRRESAGIYCRKILICQSAELDQPIKDRAKESGIRLIYGTALQNQLSDKLYAAIHY